MQQHDSGELPMPSVPSQESSYLPEYPVAARRVFRQSIGLYRRYMVSCLQQSFWANVWLVLPMLMGLAGLRAYQQMAAIALWQWLLGLIISLLGVAGYCAGCGRLSRWAWLHLQPKPPTFAPSSLSESAAESTPPPAGLSEDGAGSGSLSWRKRLEFGLLAFQLGSISTGVLMLAYAGLSLLVPALYFVLTLGTSLAAIAVAQFPPTAVQHTVIRSIVLILLLFTIGTVWIVLRFLLHFFLAEAILAIRPVATAGSSLRQSWRMTRRSTRLLLRLAVLIWLLTMPLQLPTQLASWLLVVKLGAWMLPDQPHWLLQRLAVGVGCWTVGWLSLPLWQIAKAYLYQHWRHRAQVQNSPAPHWWQA